MSFIANLFVAGITTLAWLSIAWLFGWLPVSPAVTALMCFAAFTGCRITDTEREVRALRARLDRLPPDPLDIPTHGRTF